MSKELDYNNEKIVGQCKSSVSKELDEFEKIISRLEYLELQHTLGNSDEFPIPLFNIESIREKLQEIEAIDNVKPSEALLKLKENTEMFDEIAQENNHSYKDDTVIEAYLYYLNNNIIEQALIKAQEQEKVLNIIIKKNVSVWGFRNRVFGYQKKQNGNRIINDTYEYYLDVFGCYHNGFDIELLTEEEFNLLKEMIK